jgi:glycosyltransferase involved in cell wall biosynthesis
MSKKIKIAYVIDRLSTDLAGTESQLIKMINGLDREVFQVELICLDGSAWLQQHQSSLGCPSQTIQINGFFKPSAWANFFTLMRVFRRNKPDIVHTFFPVANIIGVLAAKYAGIAHIVSSRRDYGEWMNVHYLTATKLANRFVSKIVANSNEVRVLTEKVEKIGNGKLAVIYNGLDVQKFANVRRDINLRRRLSIPERDTVIGIIANFRPMKHHHTFIKAAAEVAMKRHDVSFLLVGEGPTMTDTKTLGEALGISKKLYFADSQKDVMPFLSVMDIGVNCSEMEGFSNAVMEYMAVGVPCIVSNSGGNRDLVTHDVNGYTFNLGDDKTLAVLILDLIDNETKRARFIAAAFEKVKREMDLHTMLSRYESLYSNLVRHSGSH